MNNKKHESDTRYFPPGEYLGDIMLDDYAKKLGISVEEYGDLLAGDLAVDYNLAKKIEKLTDVSAETRLNLQTSYDNRREKGFGSSGR
ncbi:helix-turn-helix transcriptional regulator [Anaerococcus marasmi]|uniref:helix-turn-helix transcriptional regulator n=1 Tax=Anaerococcus marasmi TaxID=2057797 RepID=UPI000CFA79BB|nr:addiction module antidote protein, HigA family [Anaerococcus marasmi]